MILKLILTILSIIMIYNLKKKKKIKPIGAKFRTFENNKS